MLMYRESGEWDDDLLVRAAEEEALLNTEMEPEPEPALRTPM